MKKSVLILVCIFSLSCATPPRGSAPRREEIPVPDREEPALQVATLMERMSLRDRIAQRFITYIPRKLSHREIEDFLRENRPGGLILYRWDCPNYQETRDLTGLVDTVLREATGGVGPLICADQEGGRVRAFRFDGVLDLPSQFDIGRWDSPTMVASYAHITARQMMDLGLNMNLAPVLDLSDRGDRSIIGDRSFGGDPHRVSACSRAYIEAAAGAGLIPVAKHFPGHGITRIDSHGSLPVVEATAEELREGHILPFKAAVEAGIPAVMTAHILYPAIDGDYPATLSRKILTGLLRQELGFDGVIISDGLEMRAISQNYTIRETLREAIKAGVDLLLLIARHPLEEMILLVEELIEAGELTAEDIDQGTRRVLRLKESYGLLGPL